MRKDQKGHKTHLGSIAYWLWTWVRSQTVWLSVLALPSASSVKLGKSLSVLYFSFFTWKTGNNIITYLRYLCISTWAPLYKLKRHFRVDCMGLETDSGFVWIRKTGFFPQKSLRGLTRTDWLLSPTCLLSWAPSCRLQPGGDLTTTLESWRGNESVKFQ